MHVSLIAAVAENGVIGRDGKLPWHLPDDFRWFKAQTLGKPVVMGRRTWESLGRPLPGRQNIVLTRQSDYAAPGATVVRSPEAALAAAGDAEEVMVIGGGDVFGMFLPRATRVYLTRVNAVVEGDAWFPEFEGGDWWLVSREHHGTDARHRYEFEFCVYERVDK
ncbi:MAG TPA: type 3 dihydrofolate reductase [Woeseiaceae bacterium]|nr:type 3 dihydrofolate reductase [Woeseiaceae bacterium]